MELTSIKYTKAEKKERKVSADAAITMDTKDYPYDAEVYFSTETVKKVPGMKDLDQGDEVMLQARCEVKSISKTTSERDGKKDVSYSVVLLMKEIGVEDLKSFDSGFKDKADK